MKRSAIVWLAALALFGCDVSRNVIEKDTDADVTVKPQRDGQMAAFWHTIVNVQGDLFGWGRNDGGVILGATATSVTTPVSLPNAPTLRGLVAGNGYSCGLDEDSGVACWGRNTAGQLGQGDLEPRSGVVTVSLPAPVAALSAGQAHVCAALKDGSAWCWGLNQEWQLALDDQLAPHPAPTRVRDFSDVVAVAAGGGHTCVLRAPGSLWCWGRDISAADPKTASQIRAPKRLGDRDDFVQVSASEFSSCALNRGGAAYCWGRNEFGQLGDAAPAVSLTTVVTQPTRVAPNQRFVLVQAGHFDSCAFSVEQQLWCWGRNEFGELGLGDQLLHGEPTRLLPAQPVVEFALGWQHLCVRAIDGSISCAGRSTEGQVGNGSTEDSSSFSNVALP